MALSEGRAVYHCELGGRGWRGEKDEEGKKEVDEEGRASFGVVELLSCCNFCNGVFEAIEGDEMEASGV